MSKAKQKKDAPLHEFIGLVGAGISLILLLGSIGYTGGIIVEHICRVARLLFGAGSTVVFLYLLFASLVLMAEKWRKRLCTATASFMLLLVTSLGFAHMMTPLGEEFTNEFITKRGGFIGAVVVALLRRAFGDVGSYIALSLIAISAIFIAVGSPPSEFFASLWQKMRALRERLKRTTSTQRLQKVRKEGTHAEKPSKEKELAGSTISDAQAQKQEVPADKDSTEHNGEGQTLDEGFAIPHVITEERRTKRKRFKLLPDHYEKVIEALDKPSSSDIVDSETDTEEGVRLVEKTLASFKIDAKVVSVKRGPVVTRYEVQLAPGIRVSRIANLADDLALALAAIDVRVEAPVPGMSVIGIEVPNKRVALVRLRELLELDEFKRSPSKLTFGLGKDIAGNPKFADLARMPHLLIGGATNSGKSVCLNSIAISLLSRADPDEVKLLLIDPKRVELSLFDGIPHLVHPVVVDVRHAVLALQCVVKEMERRYELFAEKGVRNIESYNAKLSEDEEPLYHIVILIDELADLMMQAPAEIERLICRIAQLARATGIHLVIATQRPSVNVITGVIKANIPSRIAFAVASQVDSRTILDMNGAERLIGRGDMLYYPIDAPKPIRLQGAFVSEEEVNRVVETLINEYGEPEEYLFDLHELDEEMKAQVQKPEKKDPLFDAAVELVRRKGYASASMLQREFEIGYPRAAKIIDQMERAGIVGPPEGSKPRRVLIPLVDEPAQGRMEKLSSEDADEEACEDDVGGGYKFGNN
jgi:S-DNA-T family DNA segregation ATPase FtsK/SpoIIIE